MKLRERRLAPGWYPPSSTGCQASIRGFLDVSPQSPAQGAARHGIVPHAGWYFSGRAAAHVYDAVARQSQPDVVVIYGGHLGPSDTPVLYDYDAWETPFGELPVDRPLTEKLQSLIETRAEGRHGDNTVEVQIAMIRHFFPKATVAAVHAPNGPRAIELGQAVCAAAEQLGRQIAAFGAADLTHYGPGYGFAPKGEGPAAVAWVKDENDREIIDLTLQMDAPGALRSADERHNCCSSGAVAAAIATATAQGLSKAELLDYYTSYDIAPGSSIVGYMGVVFGLG